MKRLWIKASILLVCLCTLTMSSAALAAPKPTGVKISQATATIDLSVGKTLQLDGDVLPSTASQKLQWKTSNTAVATVSQTGLVTAKKTGTVTIYVRPYNVNKIKSCVVTIKDGAKPSSITVSATSITMSIGEQQTIEATVNPSTASQLVSWESKSSAIASVSSNGTVLAKKAGKTQLRVRSKKNTSVYKLINVTIQKQAAPTRIEITPTTREMDVGDTLTLKASPIPAAASASVAWASSNTKIATVSASGVVTAKTTGTVKIAATSKLKTSVKTIRTLTISDPNSLTGVSINQEDVYLSVGDTATLTATLRPSGARSTLSWSSSNTNAVSVDSSTGKIRANRVGTAKITVKTATGGYADSITVTVLDTDRALELPDRTTSISGIKENLAKIDAIRISATNEISSLLARNVITPNDANKRKSAIVNAFSMYRFPWMTEKARSYWNKPTLDNQYQTGVVYFGMPYTQTRRTYNLAKALSGKFFTQTSGGYYLMNTTPSYYVGNDCSSFVSMCIFGMNSTSSYDTTRDIYPSNRYKTITGSNNMRPGDVLVKNNVHVVMFLYYTDNAKTQMMIIEQGGGEEPNTIACRTKLISTYTNNGYIIRRPLIFS